jgi:hypothetical protein
MNPSPAWENPSQDLQHLHILSILHYVKAGLLGLLALLPLIYVAVGAGMLSGAFPGTASSPPPPAIMGWLFVAIGGTLVVLGELLAILIASAGYLLSRRRHRMFCIVVAAVECLSMPLGTVLGVFTILVLMRPSVQALFESGAPGTA